MSKAKEKGHDSVITIGGIQSNHCRATAVAASYLGLKSHLILRMSRNEAEKDPRLTGNLLVSRMLGTSIHKVTKEEYVREGSVKLCEVLEARLESQGKRPYVIPVGGSNSLGTWGYLEAMREVQEQSIAAFSTDGYFTDIAMACGSGGTSAGIALGARLSGMNQRVHAFAVCDDEDYFYSFTDGLITGLYESSVARDAIPLSRSLMRVSMAKGSGYAVSTREELEFVKSIAEATGVILDPVYSGKALFKMMNEIKANPEEWEGRKVLFFHTGGLLGLWDKEDQLMEIVDKNPKASRLLI
jgi:D-cysteine desulfhydrase